jgi:hypothetical protein
MPLVSGAFCSALRTVAQDPSPLMQPCPLAFSPKPAMDRRASCGRPTQAGQATA